MTHRCPHIAIIGAGDVGSTTAYALLMSNLNAHILLIDINEDRCAGELLDLTDAANFSSSSSVYHAQFEDAKNADIIIISAGIRQKKGESRANLASVNAKIVASIFDKITPLNPETVIIMVTNPVDIMTCYAKKYANLEPSRIFGTGTYLDTKRLVSLISKRLSIACESILISVIGEHGDTQFPVWSMAQVDGAPLAKLIPDPKELEVFAQEGRNRGYEIINCKGATYFGIAQCIVEMCAAILLDQKKMMPLSCFNQQYDLYCSLPAILGKNGIERLLPLSLDETEKKLLETSIRFLKETYTNNF